MYLAPAGHQEPTPKISLPAQGQAPIGVEGWCRRGVRASVRPGEPVVDGRRRNHRHRVVVVADGPALCQGPLQVTVIGTPLSADGDLDIPARKTLARDGRRI